MIKKLHQKFISFTNFANKRIIVSDFEELDEYDEWNKKIALEFIRFMAFNPMFSTNDIQEFVLVLETLLYCLDLSSIKTISLQTVGLHSFIRYGLEYYGLDKTNHDRWIYIIQYFLFWAKKQYPIQMSKVSISWIRSIGVYVFLNHSGNLRYDKNFY